MWWMRVSSATVAPVALEASGPSVAMSSLAKRPVTAWVASEAIISTTDHPPSGLWPAWCATSRANSVRA